MVDTKSRWKGFTDRGRWAARGTSFVAKLKATRAVWFPPGPVDAGKKTAATAKRTTSKATKGATKKTAGTAKKAGTTKKAGATKKVSAARKTSADKKVTKPVGPKTT